MWPIATVLGMVSAEDVDHLMVVGTAMSSLGCRSAEHTSCCLGWVVLLLLAGKLQSNFAG